MNRTTWDVLQKKRSKKARGIYEDRHGFATARGINQDRIGFVFAKNKKKRIGLFERVLNLVQIFGETKKSRRYKALSIPRTNRTIRDFLMR